MNLGRLARTVARLHPLQIAARPPHIAVARALYAVPRAMPPEAVQTWPRPSDALRALASAERARGATRLTQLRPGSRLRAYEALYGLELGADDSVAPADWRSRTAIEPYPASVRARRIAVAMRCGRPGLASELARAARAVLVQLELHLLGNHLLENGFALACAGAATRGVEADLWWHAGTLILESQLPAQFLPDGGHVERSASYHLALTAALLETIELARAAGRPAPSTWQAVASQALGWVVAVGTPDGAYPLFNDAAIDAAPAIEGVRALGVALGLAGTAVGTVTASDGARIVRLEPTGWVRAESGDACVVVDAGPDAEGWQPGHAHADGLTFEAWLGRERAIVDFGVESYEEGTEREATRATRSHNTAELGGCDSCEVWGAFRVGRRGRGKIVAARALPGRVELDLEHDGYSHRAGAPRHLRTMTLSPRRLEIRDRMPGAEDPWVSRLRFDARAAERVRVYGQSLAHPSAWYPWHGQARPAALFEQHAGGGDAQVTWVVEW